MDLNKQKSVAQMEGERLIKYVCPDYVCKDLQKSQGKGRQQ